MFRATVKGEIVEALTFFNLSEVVRRQYGGSGAPRMWVSDENAREKWLSWRGDVVFSANMPLPDPQVFADWVSAISGVPASGVKLDVLRDYCMPAGELYALRLALGFSRTALADALGVKRSVVAKWETGTARIPEGVETELAELESWFDSQVRLLAKDLEGLPESKRTVTIFDNDITFRRANPTDRFGSAAVHARVAFEATRMVHGAKCVTLMDRASGRVE